MAKGLGAAIGSKVFGAASKFLRDSWQDAFGNKTVTVSKFHSKNSLTILTFQIDVETYPEKIRQFFIKDIGKKLDKFKQKYSKKVTEYVKDLSKTQIKDLAKTISLSNNLDALSGGALKAIKQIEGTIEDFQYLLRNINFFIRQEHNIVRYKLDTSSNARNWNFYVKAKLM